MAVVLFGGQERTDFLKVEDGLDAVRQAHGDYLDPKLCENTKVIFNYSKLKEFKDGDVVGTMDWQENTINLMPYFPQLADVAAHEYLHCYSQQYTEFVENALNKETAKALVEGATDYFTMKTRAGKYAGYPEEIKLVKKIVNELNKGGDVKAGLRILKKAYFNSDPWALKVITKTATKLFGWEPNAGVDLSTLGYGIDTVLNEYKASLDQKKCVNPKILDADTMDSNPELSIASAREYLNCYGEEFASFIREALNEENAKKLTEDMTDYFIMKTPLGEYLKADLKGLENIKKIEKGFVTDPKGFQRGYFKNDKSDMENIIIGAIRHYGWKPKNGWNPKHLNEDNPSPPLLK